MLHTDCVPEVFELQCCQISPSFGELKAGVRDCPFSKFRRERRQKRVQLLLSDGKAIQGVSYVFFNVGLS